jgi:hypothetical protein
MSISDDTEKYKSIIAKAGCDITNSNIYTQCFKLMSYVENTLLVGKGRLDHIWCDLRSPAEVVEYLVEAQVKLDGINTEEELLKLCYAVHDDLGIEATIEDYNGRCRKYLVDTDYLPSYLAPSDSDISLMNHLEESLKKQGFTVPWAAETPLE